jgi:bifunctional UDP-N-acetylglucosamine pyrophosphorylase/glucosamine-1-phosphate N-acetyltransferase
MTEESTPPRRGWSAVVMAAGRGLRMNSSTPKVLHRLCGLEMAAWVVQSLQEIGVSPIVLVVPSQHEAFGHAFGNQVKYAVQENPGGTGDALAAARPIVGDAENLLVLNGDHPLVLPNTILRLVEAHERTGSSLSLVAAEEAPEEGMGRIVERDGGVVAVAEAADLQDADAQGLAVNVGIYAFRSPWLWDALQDLAPSPSGELYLTGVVQKASNAGLRVERTWVEDPLEALGINTRAHLARAEAALRQRINARWLKAGVTLVDPATSYIDARVTLGRDTVIQPNTMLRGNTIIGEECEVGPNAIIGDSLLGNRCSIGASVIEGATLEDGVDVGHFCRLREGAYLEQGVHVGTSAEVKASRLRRDAQMGHFSYVGNADIGERVNIGAGTITCNFDGVRKNKTIVEEDAFIGSDTLLVAPVRIGARSATGAGAVVNHDVPPDSLAVGIPARVRRRTLPPDARDLEPSNTHLTGPGFIGA